MITKKRLFSLFLVITLISISFIGCGILKSNSDTTLNSWHDATNNSKELVSGQYYVWHDENQTDIAKDIGADASKFKKYKYKIFQPVFFEDKVLSEYVGDTQEESDSRVYGFLDENEDSIPTLFSGDELIYYSSESLPETFHFERLYTHGYSIGMWGLQENIKGSNKYVLSKATGGMKPSSCDGTKQLSNAMSGDDEIVISIDSVGDKKLTNKDISKSGTIKGLKKDSTYDVDCYLGTRRATLKMSANVLLMSSMEAFDATGYDFVGNGIAKIQLPDYMETGYYIINGIGLFRYVNGKSYSASTNFNDPIVERDEKGDIVYDPRDTELDETEYDNDDAINDGSYVPSIQTKIVLDKARSVAINVNFTGYTESGKTDAEKSQDQYIKDTSTEEILNKVQNADKSNFDFSYITADDIQLAKDVLEQTDNTSGKDSAKANYAPVTTNKKLVISCYCVKNNPSSPIKSGEKGSSSNPYKISVTQDDINQGIFTKNIDLPAGTWIIKLADVSDFENALISVQ